jgi:hypothetical protein
VAAHIHRHTTGSATDQVQVGRALAEQTLLQIAILSRPRLVSERRKGPVPLCLQSCLLGDAGQLLLCLGHLLGPALLLTRPISHTRHSISATQLCPT